jgi:hypothetical protein
VAESVALKLESLKKENAETQRSIDAKEQAFNELSDDLVKRDRDVKARELDMRANETRINEYQKFEQFLRSREDLIDPQLHGLTEHAKQQQSDHESQLQDLHAREQIVKQREAELSQKRVEARFRR